MKGDLQSGRMADPILSIVIPAFNEQENVELELNLSQRLEPHMQSVSPEPETVLLVRRAR